jgi:hypothetical protein
MANYSHLLGMAQQLVQQPSEAAQQVSHVGHGHVTGKFESQRRQACNTTLQDSECTSSDASTCCMAEMLRSPQKLRAVAVLKVLAQSNTAVSRHPIDSLPA